MQRILTIQKEILLRFEQIQIFSCPKTCIILFLLRIHVKKNIMSLLVKIYTYYLKYLCTHNRKTCENEYITQYIMFAMD
jgi:hypothetical protein